MQCSGGAGGVAVEDLLAISPPPEFQDFPAPPPSSYRDRSRSPVPVVGRQKGLVEFASRISFDILNEAMVIATEEVVSLLLQHDENPCSSSQMQASSRKLSSSSGRRVVENSRIPSTDLSSDENHCSSDSDYDDGDAGFSNPVSLTASWEYLPQICEGEGEGVSGSDCDHHDLVEQKRRLADDAPQNLQGQPKRHFPCDDYSLPLDNLSHSQTVGDDKEIAHPSVVKLNGICNVETVTQTDPTVHRTTCSSRSSTVHSNNSCFVHAVLNRTLEVPNTSTHHSLVESDICDRQSSIDDEVSRSLANDNFELTMPGIGCYQIDPSQISISSSASSGTGGRIGGDNSSTKVEKRNLGHSILNLFKRKSRLKTGLHHHEEETFRDLVSPPRTHSTTARALPEPPVIVADTGGNSEDDLDASGHEAFDSVNPSHMDLPWSDDEVSEEPFEAKDFSASIEKVKDCGWYWGPLSSESAEDLLRGEPDGSFIVRDSSDVRYIFSLTFKLNGLVRHVRIEHDQGNFSFGPLTRFKASTIVDFVEKAVAHSRSGRYLFFLHRRPVLGPMRVQLLHPYSRFRHPRSLQHMCRFVILKHVRRDLIHMLPLPKPLLTYLNTPHYYFEKP